MINLKHCRFCTHGENGKPLPLPGRRLRCVLKSMDLTDAIGCGCNSGAAQMDRWGPDGCRENLPTIAGWLRDAAIERNIEVTDEQIVELITAAIVAAEQDGAP